MAEVLLIAAGLGVIITIIGFFTRKNKTQSASNETQSFSKQILQQPHSIIEENISTSTSKTIPLTPQNNFHETQILTNSPSVQNDKTKLLHSSNKPSPKLKIQSLTQSFVFQINQLPITIGKSPKADLCIDDKALSDFHANILLENGFLYIEDSGSSSGVWIENKSIQKNKLIENQIINIGNTTITFVYE